MHANTPAAEIVWHHHRRRAVLLVILALLMTALASATFFRSGRNSEPVLPREVCHGPSSQRMVALTFDAGGEAGHLEELLNALAKERRHSTFFITGRWAAEHPELVREIARRGHEIGNHTFAHKDLTQLGDEQIRFQLLEAERVLAPLIGKSPRPLWRAPYGARDDRVLSIASSLGYTSIYWSLDSLDSVGEPKSAGFINDRITSQPSTALSGGIILMHVGEKGTAEAVPALLANLRQRRLSPVTVSELLR